jgi:hypothetical protein
LIFGAIAKISNIYQFVDFLSKAQKKTLNWQLKALANES